MAKRCSLAVTNHYARWRLKPQSFGSMNIYALEAETMDSASEALEVGTKQGRFPGSHILRDGFLYGDIPSLADPL